MKNKILYLTLIITQCFTPLLYAQDAFNYQAVVRDSSGNVLPNQLIGIQAGILQDENTQTLIYQETHQTISNDYGVINLEIGNGITDLGDFSSINWGLKCFLQIDIDISGGTNYTLSSLSEILSVPKAVYAERAGRIDGTGFGLIVTDFGAVGDGQTDDTEAFEAALDSATVLGAKVFVPAGIYKITRTLNISDGVTLIGEGPGSDPLETPYNGSLLWYFGNEFALKVNGHNSRLRDLVVRDKSNENAQGGILLEADGRLLENVYFEEVLISGFTSGTALKLHAKNEGGIAFASFNNVRVRHGNIGIHILEDNTSFVNSNTWNHCLVSGGGFKHGLHVEGGNNNNFNALIIEPYTSTHGHLYVEKGHIFCSQIRIEGTQQPETIPLIYFDRYTQNSEITGVYAGGLTIDKGNNFINMKSGRAIHYRNSSFNKFLNATFSTPDDATIPDWEITGNFEDLEIFPPQLTESHNVLKLSIPAGGIARLEPMPLSRPAIKELSLYDQVNFGFYVKAEIPNFAHAFTNATSGWTRSTFHSGSGDWEFIGMNAAVDRNAQGRFALQISNTTGTTQDIFISTPTLNFGNQLPTLDQQPIFSSGGQLYGLLIDAFAEDDIPNNGFLDLPRTANYFEINGSTNIHRVNFQTANRFPKGSVITLLFNESGVGVSNSGYLILKSGFTSGTNSSLTLISNGDGTWREVSRNE